MTSMVRIYNDGPDDLEVTTGGRRPVVVPAGSVVQFTTRQTVDLSSPNPLTDDEMAHHMGVTADQFKEANRPPPRVVEP